MLTAVFLVSALQSQEPSASREALASREAPASSEAGEGIFPLALVLEAAEYAGDGCRTWRPDWPVELPPDAFKFISGISRIAIEGENFSLVFDSGRDVLKFPFILNSRVAQVSLVYRDAQIAELREMTLVFPSGEEPWQLEFLEYKDAYPAIVRCFRSDTWYFIVLSRKRNEISETWYDEDGNFLCAYGFPLIEIGNNQRIRAIRRWGPGIDENSTEFYYDSRGFLTESTGPDGVYKVQYYLEDLPRYWERRPVEIDTGGIDDTAGAGKFSLQWDKEGLLRSIAVDTEKPEAAVSYRYEYTLDGMGNWIERREIRMFRRLGLLVPLPGTTFRRVLEYKNP